MIILQAAGIFHHLITLPTYHTAALSTDYLAKGSEVLSVYTYTTFGRLDYGNSQSFLLQILRAGRDVVLREGCPETRDPDSVGLRQTSGYGQQFLRNMSFYWRLTLVILRRAPTWATITSNTSPGTPPSKLGARTTPWTSLKLRWIERPWSGTW